MYKYMFTPDQRKNTLAIIGCLQPCGSLMPICEMQCRLASRVFKGLKALPNSNEMWRDIRAKQRAMASRDIGSMRHTIEVDWLPFMDELAELVGCKPNFWKLCTDPKLAIEVYFGPCTPYQYRLKGPGHWKGARQAIMTQWERNYKPLQTRPCEKGTSSGFETIYVWIVLALAVLIYFIL